MNLLRLAHIVESVEYPKLMRGIFIAFADRLESAPQSLPYMMSAYMIHEASVKQVLGDVYKKYSYVWRIFNRSRF